MHSRLFEQSNLENETGARFALQNPQLLRVHLGGDVLAVKGSMVAYQGRITFEHQGAGSMGRLLKKMVAGDDVPLMRVSGEGDVFFANDAGYVYLVELTGDGITVNGRNLLAFDSSVSWDIRRVQGAGALTGGLFNTVLEGAGTVALAAVGQPVVLDCSQQPTYVDLQSAVAWSTTLVPQVVSSMSMRSMLHGGSGEAFQYVFHGPGFVVVQPSEWTPAAAGGQQRSGGGLLGDLLNG